MHLRSVGVIRNALRSNGYVNFITVTDKSQQKNADTTRGSAFFSGLKLFSEKGCGCLHKFDLDALLVLGHSGCGGFKRVK